LFAQPCKAPEDINDNPETAPSKRIIHYFPVYQKVFQGIIAAKRIGIELMRKECSHFNSWLEHLESYQFNTKKT
jgi:trehalose-6-phosphate synthase